MTNTGNEWLKYQQFEWKMKWNKYLIIHVSTLQIGICTVEIHNGYCEVTQLFVISNYYTSFLIPDWATTTKNGSSNETKLCLLHNACNYNIWYEQFYFNIKFRGTGNLSIFLYHPRNLMLNSTYKMYLIQIFIIIKILNLLCFHVQFSHVFFSSRGNRWFKNSLKFTIKENPCDFVSSFNISYWIAFKIFSYVLKILTKFNLILPPNPWFF